MVVIFLLCLFFLSSSPSPSPSSFSSSFFSSASSPQPYFLHQSGSACWCQFSITSTTTKAVAELKYLYPWICFLIAIIPKQLVTVSACSSSCMPQACFDFSNNLLFLPFLSFLLPWPHILGSWSLFKCSACGCVSGCLNGTLTVCFNESSSTLEKKRIEKQSCLVRIQSFSEHLGVEPYYKCC